MDSLKPDIFVVGDVCVYLNDDPLSRGSSVHERYEESPELLNDLARDVEEKRKRFPCDPFWRRSERVDGDVGVANEIRMSGRFYKPRISTIV